MTKIVKKLASSLGAAALALSALALLLCPSVTSQAAAAGLSTCVKSILPSLFPFFVITNLWTSMGYADSLSRWAMPVMEPVFHLPGAAASALLLGCIGGYPVGAALTIQLYQSHAVDRDQAQHMLFFCNNAGPAFIFGVIGTALFQSTAIGAVLYLIHVCSALILGVLFRPKRRPANMPDRLDRADKQAFPSAFTSAIRQAGSTTVQVCVFVLFFSILTGFLSYFLPLGLLESPWSSIVLGSMELAGGAGLLAASSCSAVWKLCASAFLLGWAGLCVHSQTLSILDGTGLSSAPYLLGKLLQGILSAAIAWGLAPLLPLPSPCSTAREAAWHGPVLQIVLLTMFLLWAGHFLKITSGKPDGNPI